MAKLSRSKLKLVIKECLLEILNEGLGETSEIIREAKVKRKKIKKSIFDQLDDGLSDSGKRSIKFNNSVRTAVSAATDDPVLQKILEETAKTTFQDQIQHESSSPSFQTNLNPMTASPSAGLDIDTLFESASKNWGEVLERSSKKMP